MENAIIANTLNGPVKGKKYRTFYGKDVYAFYRIPYMKPPIGKLRFKDPKPVDNWTHVIDGTEETGKFAQFNHWLQEYCGDETELYINVFTRNLKPNELQPIVISIHGGGFTAGSSSNEMYGPDNFLRENIIFFSFNYRLSVLGFLSFDDPNLKVPGNAGLKDQTLALKWIKNNAECFGGNPNNITLLGLSAGGASVNYHLISDMSQNLFHKAIIMSGGVLNNWTNVPDNKFSIRLAKKFGWNEDEDYTTALETLQNVPIQELVMEQNMILTEQEVKERIYAAFVPKVEPYVSEQCFLPEPIVNMIPKQWSRHIPIIIGGTSDEGNLLWFCWEHLSRLPVTHDYIGDFKYLIPFQLGLDRQSDDCQKLGDKMRLFYFGDKELSFTDKSILTKYLILMSDKLFLYSIFATIKSRVLDNNSAPTYFYRFNLSTSFNFLSYLMQCPLKGACHGDDLNYVYSTKMFGTLEDNSSAINKVKQISSLWNNFVMVGNPNSSEIKPIIWTPVATNSTVPFKCLNISDELKMIDYPEHHRVQFWHAMFINVLNF